MNNTVPLYSLSVEQFKAILDEKFKHFQQPHTKTNVIYETDNTNIDWVSENFNIPKGTIRSKVSKREMPCKKRGKPLIFSKKEIIEWVEKGKPKIEEEIEFAPVRKKRNN